MEVKRRRRGGRRPDQRGSGMFRRFRLGALAAWTALAAALIGLGGGFAVQSNGLVAVLHAKPVQDIHLIKHIVVVMQENRSYDEYFGMYPRGDGYTLANGQPTECLPDPDTGGCDKPYHDTSD